MYDLILYNIIWYTLILQDIVIFFNTIYIHIIRYKRVEVKVYKSLQAFKSKYKSIICISCTCKWSYTLKYRKGAEVTAKLASVVRLQGKVKTVKTVYLIALAVSSTETGTGIVGTTTALIHYIHVYIIPLKNCCVHIHS